MSGLTDEDYNVIARRVYDVDPVKNKTKQREVGSTFESRGRQFKVIDAIGNGAEPTTNGMQLIEVI